jgi:hypothetical protein
MTEVPQGPETGVLREAGMVHEERWLEIQQLAAAHVTVSEIARMLAVDSKAVRRCLRQAAWQPYRRAAGDTLLTTHATWLAGRAPEVEYSARILWQELRSQHAYTGGATRRSRGGCGRCVWPRSTRASRGRGLKRPPASRARSTGGKRSYAFTAGKAVRPIFVLTLGFSRRAVCIPCAQETLHDLLDA